MAIDEIGFPAHEGVVRVSDRRIVENQSRLQLGPDRAVTMRRYTPVGVGDYIRFNDQGAEVFVRHDKFWLSIEPAWTITVNTRIGNEEVNVIFKEIETSEELELFENLRKFHYRGGGGAGRTVPIIATTELWDLPAVLGFVEISSSMIANTARKKFFDFPYSEDPTIRWKTWDRTSSKLYSNVICRISRFVIHPEIRGLGLAKLFMSAARQYAATRWHFGGFSPRFIEITADMLKFYKFIDRDFVHMGETEGNEHRLSKDMTYLVKKALSGGGGMPQGGGGIMTLQRGYAQQLMTFLEGSSRTLPDVINSLKYDPSLLDQETWEALHRLNRKPPGGTTASREAGIVFDIQDQFWTLGFEPLSSIAADAAQLAELSAWGLAPHALGNLRVLATGG